MGRYQWSRPKTFLSHTHFVLGYIRLTCDFEWIDVKPGLITSMKPEARSPKPEVRSPKCPRLARRFFGLRTSDFGLWTSICCLFLFLAAFTAPAANTLNWNTNQNRVTADIKGSPLLEVLEQIAATTGWHVFVEPDTLHLVSAKFTDLPPGEALRLLLGNVNYALLPDTNSSSRLFVFRTSRENATRLVRAARIAKKRSPSQPLPNELIVRLKPGAKIEELAKLLGAKVIGRIDGLNAYRLQFDDQAATDSVKAQLGSNSDVASVENNYTIDRPDNPLAIPGGSASPISLQLNPPGEGGRVIIGLLDTAVQPLGQDLDQFVAKRTSLAGDAPADANSPLHGTSMAETILETLQVLGKGKSSTVIYSYDFYGNNAAGNTFTLMQALAQAVNDGANPINISAGTTANSQALNDLVAEAYAKGIRIFAAKGNDGPSTDLNFPAGYTDYVTAVTAVDKSGQVYSWANQAAIRSIGAMGTVPIPYQSQEWMVEGTSPATAIASGTAGFLMENGHLSAADANTRLWSGPTPTTRPFSTALGAH